MDSLIQSIFFATLATKYPRGIRERVSVITAVANSSASTIRAIESMNMERSCQLKSGVPTCPFLTPAHQFYSEYQVEQILNAVEFSYFSASLSSVNGCIDWNVASNQQLNPRKFADLIFMPAGAVHCDCGKPFRLDPPTYPTVYTRSGPKVAANYQLRCSLRLKGCNKILSHWPCKDRKFLRFSEQTIWEKELLDETTHQIVVTGNTFTQIATVYNEFHKSYDSNRPMNSQRLEEAFLCYHSDILHQKLFPEEQITVGRESLDRTIIKLNARVREERLLANWIHHKCDVVGCSDGVVILDGNEKVRRRKCAAKVEDITSDEIPESILNITQGCPYSPITGNQYKKPSKYCQLHMRLENKNIVDSNMEFPFLLNNGLTCIGQLPSHDDPNSINYQETGCKKFENVNKFYSTTAGTLIIVRPCGIILNVTEMYKCESCTQAAVLLFQTFQFGKERLKYVGYDRSCDLHPMLQKLSRKEEWAKFLIDDVSYFVDTFHCNKHKEPSCNPGSPSVKYHLSAPRFSEIEGVNSEICEQTFRWWNRFKPVISNMTMLRAQFLTFTLINFKNSLLESKNQRKKAFNKE